MPSNTMKLALTFTAVDATAGILRGLENRILGLGTAAQKVRRDFEDMVSHTQAGLKALAASWYAVKGLEKGVKVSSDMEEAMSTLEMSMGRTGQNAAEFHKQLEKVRDTAAKVQLLFPFGQKEMVNAAVTLTQSGMKYQELASETGALYSVGALASIGKVSTVEAAEAISAGANIFGAKGDELGKMADFMQKVGTTTPLHIGLQATALREGGPEAKMLGLTYKEAFTAMGAYAKQTGDAAKAGERLMEFGHRLSGATAKEKEALEEAGLSFYDRRGKRKPFLQIIQELQRFRADLESKHPTFTEEEFNDLFKKIFEGRGEFMAFALSKRGEGSYQDVAAEAEKSYSIQEKVNIATRDFGRNVEALLGSTKTLVADAFDPLLKSLTPLVKQINDVIGALDSFAKEHRELTKDVTKGVVALMAFGAVWGSIRIVQGIISFTRVLGAFATGARVAAAAAAPLEAGVAAIATGATAAASAVASLVTALGALTWWMHSSVMEHYEKTGELPPSPNDPLDSSIQWEDPDAALIKQALRKDKGQVGGNMSSALPHPEHSYSEQMSRFVESLKVHPQVNITQNISIDQNGRVTSSTSDPDAKTTINLKRGRFMPTSFFEHD